MSAIIALILWIVTLSNPKVTHATSAMVIPPMPTKSPAWTIEELVWEYESGCMCDECYWNECFEESLDEFTNLFNSYEVKRAKTGRMMIRRAGESRFKFARMNVIGA